MVRKAFAVLKATLKGCPTKDLMRSYYFNWKISARHIPRTWKNSFSISLGFSLTETERTARYGRRGARSSHGSQPEESGAIAEPSA